MTPKSKRLLPEIGSMPTVPNSSPTTMTMRPLVTESPESVTAIRRPRSASENFSGGPKLSANSAIGGAKSVRPTTATDPAMKDPMAAMPSAGPARPFWAIL